MGHIAITLKIALAALGLLALAHLYWKHVWFLRNPLRIVPERDCVVSPADGTVVYAREVAPGEPVISTKQGVSARVGDIVREDVWAPKIVIGIFMSPFDVHYNRVPLPGTVESVRHHPPAGRNLSMLAMHWRTVLGIRNAFSRSNHVVTNERTVTRIRGEFAGHALTCYVVQIAGRWVSGIESFLEEGRGAAKGELLGVIKIGSQVDLVVTKVAGMRIAVSEGEKVRAGETALIEREQTTNC